MRFAAPSGFTTLITPHLARLQRMAPEVSLELLSSSKHEHLISGVEVTALFDGASQPAPAKSDA